MREFLQDVRHGARLLVKQPAFTAVTGVTLALAIGANTIIFSIVSFLLLRPLPFKDRDALAAVFAVDPNRGNDRARVSEPDYLEWRAETRAFEALGAWRADTGTLTGVEEPLRLRVQRVTANLLDIWSLEMARGRSFLPGEDQPAAAPVAIVGHGFWQRYFAGDPGIVGRTIGLNGVAHTIVGVMTPEMEIGNLSLVDLWTPLTLDPDRPRDDRRLQVYGRLAPGATVEQASAEIATIARRQAGAFPLTNEGWGARVVPLLEAMTGRNAWVVLTLLGVVVALVLVIACANVANLMLARAVARRKELAVRAALGAGRMRLVRQMVTESLLLGLTGGALGLVLARGGLAVFRAVPSEPIFRQISIDQRVLLFVALLSLLTPLLFALLPALHAARADLSEALNEGAGRTSGGVRGRRGRNALVVAQLSLAAALLVLSTLIIRTAVAQARLDLGFDPANVLTLQIELQGDRYAGDEEVRLFYDAALARLAGLPGVAHASAASALPAFGGLSQTAFGIEGQPAPAPADRPWALQAVVSPGYFAAFDIPLLRGRGFTTADDARAPGVALVSAEAARRYWRDIDPVGRRVRLGDDDGPWLEIVGVVADVFNREQFGEGSDPQLYVPLSQHPRRAMAVALRTTTDPAALIPAVRRELRAEDPDQALFDVRTMAQTFREELASDRLIFGMFAAFALVALLLAAAGLYGVMSYSVAQRAQEFGVRLALGARAGDVVRLVVRQGLVLVALGLTLGLLGGFGLASAIARLLFGVGPADPLTYGGVAALLVGVALLASYIPARRAVALDPIRTLRQ
jgi:putative ABC transport system permease protein